MGDSFPGEIDLVMKGGITSGVVYPRAVAKLSVGTRIRSVGGTSAGAIAAAVTAAAEHARTDVKDGLNFGAIEDELKREGFLLSLFQPTPETRALFDLLVEGQKEMGRREKQAHDRKKKREEAQSRGASARELEALEDPSRWRSALHWVFFIDRCLAAAQRDPGPALVVFAAALIALGASGATLLASALNAKATLIAALSLLIALVLSLAAGLVTRWLWNALPLVAAARTLVDPERGHFGFCAGRGVGREGLTDWLHRHIQAQAALPPHRPLTFEDLDPPPGAPAAPRPRVKLRMVTTNLSRSESTSLPFTRSGILFRRSDFDAMFPAEVVNALVKEGEKEDASFVPPDGFHRLPDRDKLPVVVATRLSLSFPGLLRAVRLYVVPGAFFDAQRRAGKKPPYLVDSGDLEVQWLSDGGVTSNFPLHVFDVWLPERPTIGISLADAPLATALPRPVALDTPEAVVKGDRDKVRMRAARENPDGDEFRACREIGGLAGFLAGLFDSARNHADNAQMGLASYRERVVDVELDPDEGGLNLDMPAAVIKALQERGGKAGERARTHFPAEEHRWVRLRVLMAHLEEEFDRLEATRARRSDKQLSGLFKELAEAQLAAAAAGEAWYRREDADWCDLARGRIAAIDALLDRWRELGAAPTSERVKDPRRLFRTRAPAPGGVLRMTPAFGPPPGGPLTP